MSCKEIASICRVNKTFHNLCGHEDYWERQCRRLLYDRFGGHRLVGNPGHPPGGGTWREYYIWRCMKYPVDNHVSDTIDAAFVGAASQGYLPIVSGLLAVPGINVNAADNRGSTALIWAASLNHVDIIPALLAVPRSAP